MVILHQLCLAFSSFEESRASKNKPVQQTAHLVQTLSNHIISFVFVFEQSSIIHHLHKMPLFCASMPVGIGLIHSWAAYIHCCCCCFNGVLRFLSPPWYSIGTVLDNVKDTN